MRNTEEDTTRRSKPTSGATSPGIVIDGQIEQAAELIAPTGSGPETFGDWLRVCLEGFAQGLAGDD